jgi:hypothetical protein
MQTLEAHQQTLNRHLSKSKAQTNQEKKAQKRLDLK